MITLEFNIVMFVLLLFIAFLCILAIKSGMSRKLTFTKMFILFLFILFCFKVTYVKFSKKKPTLSILIDTSYSMKYGDKLKDVIELSKKIRPSFERYTESKWYEFAEEVKPVSELTSLKLRKENTDIAKAISHAKVGADAILLFSDGFHNSATDLEKSLSMTEITVYPVIFDNWRAYKDAVISDMDVPKLGFKNIPCEVSVKLMVFGYKNTKLNIKLKDGKIEIASKEILVDKDDYIDALNLSFVPREVGEKTYTVEISELVGEASYLNNRKTFSMFVSREKVRVLYLCGRPGYEYYFLRDLLKSDPLIELVSFVILRNPENLALAPDEELSLIPFPTHELFTRDIFNFDVLILENFTYTKFPITREHLSNIAKFVKERSGGFVMIAGESSFGKGWYMNTPLEEIIPLTMDSPRDEILPGEFRPIVENEHPIVRLLPDKLENLNLWRKLPTLECVQKLKPRENFTILKHPQGYVVLSAAEFGNGRAVALGTATTWRWALGSAGLNLPINPHHVFWKNIVYWVAKVPLEKSYKLIFHRNVYEVNEKIDFSIIPLNKSIVDKKVEFRVRTPDGKVTYFDMPFDMGRWEGSYIPQSIGKYEFEFFADFIEGSERRNVVVYPAIYREEKHLGLNLETLMKIADKTGGRVINENEVTQLLQELHDRTKKFVTARIDIGSSPILPVILIISLIVDWLIRRISGYH